MLHFGHPYPSLFIVQSFKEIRLQYCDNYTVSVYVKVVCPTPMLWGDMHSLRHFNLGKIN